MVQGVESIKVRAGRQEVPNYVQICPGHICFRAVGSRDERGDAPCAEGPALRSENGNPRWADKASKEL